MPTWREVIIYLAGAEIQRVAWQKRANMWFPAEGSGKSVLLARSALAEPSKPSKKPSRARARERGVTVQNSTYTAVMAGFETA